MSPIESRFHSIQRWCDISQEIVKLLGRVSAIIGCAQVIAFGIGAQFKVHARYLKRLSRITWTRISNYMHKFIGRSQGLDFGFRYIAIQLKIHSKCCLKLLLDASSRIKVPANAMLFNIYKQVFTSSIFPISVLFKILQKSKDRKICNNFEATLYQCS